MAWWWCLEHKQVEEGLGCGSSSRVGPYARREQAATALERIRQRAAEQEAKDKAEEEERKKKAR